MLKDNTIFGLFPILVMLMVCKPIVNGLPIDKTAMVGYSYIIYAAMSLCCLVYFIRHMNRILHSFRLLSYFYIYLLIYVVIGWVSTFFTPSGLFVFFRFQISTALICFGGIFVFENEKVRNATLSMYWKWLPFVFLGSIFFAEKQGYMYTFAPALFYLCFWRFLPIRRRLVCLLLVGFMLYYAMQQRIDYISVLVPLFMLIIYRAFNGRVSFGAKTLFYLLMMIPVFLWVLAFTGTFNVLAFEDYIEEDMSTESAGNFLDDTRTFLYEEAYYSAVKHDYVIQGRTPCYGYDSFFVEEAEGRKGVGGALHVRGQMMQRVSEVGIVNLFTWCGLMGCLIYFLWFCRIGSKAVSSKNGLVRMLGFYVAFFWMLSWISFILLSPSMNYILLFLVISIIYNQDIHSMSNRKASVYFRHLLAR